MKPWQLSELSINWLRVGVIILFIATWIFVVTFVMPHNAAPQIPEQVQFASRSAVLNGQPINLLLAQTHTEQYQGLSDRSRICDACGMLFTFSESQPRTFVMRRMKFPLDIVWVREGKVVGVSADLPPQEIEPYIPYSSGEAADTVLEVPAGSAERYGLRPGENFNLQ